MFSSQYIPTSLLSMYNLLSKTYLKWKMPLDVHLWRAFFWTEHFCLASRHTTYQICYIQCCGVFFSLRIPKVEKPYNDDLLHGCQTFWPLALRHCTLMSFRKDNVWLRSDHFTVILIQDHLVFFQNTVTLWLDNAIEILAFCISFN